MVYPQVDSNGKNVPVNLYIVNPFPTSLTIFSMQTGIGLNQTSYGHIEFAFNPGFVVPAYSSANSSNITTPNNFLLLNYYDQLEFECAINLQ
jgi:hypothetical protein